jgi:hypothetical protein
MERKKMNSIAKRSHNNNQLQSFVSVLSVAKSAFGGWLKSLKNKAKSQVNLNKVLTMIYEDQRIPDKKTNPMVCYPNPILSPKTDISTILQNLFMQNEPNGMLFKPNYRKE